MAGYREQTTGQRLDAASATVEAAWQALPHEHRNLLEEVGAGQRTIVEVALGPAIHRLLRSAGSSGLGEEAQQRLAAAVAAWVPSLRVVVLNASHPSLAGLSDRAFERFLADTAWHE